ncbi:MAG: ribosomal protein S18-alanine N-acetyltransferase [Eubacterium sp.]|nr:ribosomal protein S18-alanine N-acetyltransferase [Eubacterium sp.]
MIKYRIMEKEDIPQVARIEKACFSMPWSEKSFSDSLDQGDTLFLVAEEEGKICGYVGMYISFEVGSITNVAVASDCRRMGIGKGLITQLVADSRQRGVESITLEVRESNLPAIKLYESQGFVSEGIRKNFYQKPTENAMIMWKHKE